MKRILSLVLVVGLAGASTSSPRVPMASSAEPALLGRYSADDVILGATTGPHLGDVSRYHHEYKNNDVGEAAVVKSDPTPPAVPVNPSKEVPKRKPRGFLQPGLFGPYPKWSNY